MYKYIFKRVLMLIPVIIGVTLITFTIINLSPTDPAEIILGSDATPETIAQLREELGLNRPFFVRYFDYMAGMLRGDLGTSYKNRLPVIEQIADKLPNTLLLAFSSMVVAVAMGIPIGILSAKRQYSALDNVSTVVALIGQAAPAFWQGMVLVIIFSLGLRWFPATGMGEGFFGVLRSLVLPAITVGTSTAALVMRTTRSSMLEVKRQDYIDTARSKGLREQLVTRRHMLKNALIPIVTVVGLQFGVLLGGSVMTETVFAWPGLGRFVVESIKTKDTPCVLGSVIVMSVIFTFVNLFVDILYAYIDPRIKSQYKR